MADILNPQPAAPREYLGDGLYADFDGYQIRLWADSGDRINEVYLEPDVLTAFQRYLTKLKGGTNGG